MQDSFKKRYRVWFKRVRIARGVSGNYQSKRFQRPIEQSINLIELPKYDSSTINHEILLLEVTFLGQTQGVTKGQNHPIIRFNMALIFVTKVLLKHRHCSTVTYNIVHSHTQKKQ